MPESTPYCLLLLITVLVGVSLGAELIEKSVCRGDAVQMFTNIPWINSSIVSLYTNGDHYRLIATWTTSNTSILPQYQERVFRDDHGNIWIENIKQSDQDTYELSYQSKVQSKVRINVMVEPAEYCKPSIEQRDSYLMASLPPKDCPSTSVRWLDSPGISPSRDKSTIKLSSAQESGTYYACTESPALKCVTDLKPFDYCSSFVVKGDNRPQSVMETSPTSVQTIIISLTFALLLIFFGVVILVIVIFKRGMCGQTAESRSNGNYEIRPQIRQAELQNFLAGDGPNRGLQGAEVSRRDED